MSVVRYPKVNDEFATVQELLKGRSIGRLGDGELAVIDRRCGGRQDKASAELSGELRAFVAAPHADCMVGIPTMDKRGPKYANWSRHSNRFCARLSPGVQYWSSFITRPDSAPWIGNLKYVQLLCRLWDGKHAVVISGTRAASLLEVVQLSARKVTHVPTDVRNDYCNIDRYTDLARRAKADVVILSIGPTATVLANRLAGLGVHAVDLGSAGGFMLKLLNKVGS